MLDYDIQPVQYSPWSQLAILLSLSGVGLLVGSFISIPIANAYLDVPLTELGAALLKSENADLSRMLQFVTTFFFMAVPAFIFARIVNRNPFKYIGFNSAISGKQAFIIVGIVVTGLVVSGALEELNKIIPLSKSAETYFKSLEDEYDKAMFALAQMNTVTEYITSLIMLALLPALFEEMLFRGSLQPVLISLSKNAFRGILITGILFSAIHMSYYGFLPRLFLGIAIGYVFYYSKNLWLSVATHFLYNAIGVTQMYALSKQGMLKADVLDETFPLYYGLIGAAALYGMIYIFKKESEVVISMHNFNNYKKRNNVIDEN